MPEAWSPGVRGVGVEAGISDALWSRRVSQDAGVSQDAAPGHAEELWARGRRTACRRRTEGCETAGVSGVSAV